MGESKHNIVYVCGIMCVCVCCRGYRECGHVRGSKSIGIGMLHLAMARDAFLIVVSEILMYLRKQSLDHRPMPWMRYLGQPIAAAVDAAPIRNEWEDMLAAPSDVSRRILFMSFRVKNEPLWKAKRGPLVLGR